MARPSLFDVQLLHVVVFAAPRIARPSESEPVSMSCWFGVLPTPLTSAPFSVSALGLRTLLRSRSRSPCRSATFHAISCPLALYQGPLPMRSRALTGPCVPAATVLRYARHVRLPAPAAAASD